MINRVIRMLTQVKPYNSTEELNDENPPAVFTVDADIITSEVVGSTDLHAPVLDLDFPVAVVPSTTPGHYHLYLDWTLSKENYFKLLDTLADVGLIESGYVEASRARGYSAVRLPWITKDE